MAQQPDISDEAVIKATGRSWREWFGIMGSAGMTQKSHEDMVVFLREEHAVPSWWQQSIATAFEESIGRVFPHESEDGFHTSFILSLDLPADVVFQAWTDPVQRAKWLRHADFEPTTVREPDTVRGKWNPDKSWVEVTIAPDGEAGTKLTVDHRRLASAESAERMKTFWTQSAERLVSRIRPGR